MSELKTILARAEAQGLPAILLLLLCVVGTIGAVPFSWPMGGFWLDAQEFARSGRISSTFTPCGYPALLGLGVRIGGIVAVVAMQLLIYLIIIAAIYSVLRLLAIRPAPALIGACIVGFHPELLISIKKVWDTNITAAFLMLTCAILLAILRKGLSPGRALLTGVLWGLSVSVRPNFPVLILPIAFAFWFAPSRSSRVRSLSAGVLLAVGAATVSVISVAIAVHGSFYMPENGPYNLYAGANSFTEKALLENLNAEPSIYPSLLAEGFSRDVNVYSSVLRPYYSRRAILYCRLHPFQTIKLVFLKLFTLLRPDTKIYPLASAAGVVKTIEALAVPCWLITLFVTRNNGWGIQDSLFLVFVLAYIAPFLATNSDPRFRIPLDVLVLTHTMYRIARSSPISSWAISNAGSTQNGLVRVAN